MSRLTRDGTAEPVSRDQIFRLARGQRYIHFSCSADHEQDWQPYPVDPYSTICDGHTYIHICSPRRPSAVSCRGMFFCGTVHLLMTTTKLRSDAFVQATGDFDGNLCISLFYCRGSCCGSGWCNKAWHFPPLTGGCSEGLSAFWFFFEKLLEYPPNRQGYSLTGYFQNWNHRKMRNICQPPRHLGEILLLIVLVVHVDLFE